MESTVEAALAAKLLKLFPNTDSKFLVLPAAGAAFTRADLDFLRDDAGLDAEGLRAKMARKNQFARILNDIPADSLVYASEDRLLWNEYREVLHRAQVARSGLSGAEKQAFEIAQDYLTDEVVEDGVTTRVNSDAVQKYYEYKEAYEELTRIYDDEKSSAESATSEEKAAWFDRREPQLAALRDKALQDWGTLGSKDAVENHQATFVLLSGKAPAIHVLGYMRDLDACREPDLLTNDPVGTYSTFYSPSDVFDPRAEWSRVHIARAEIQSLLDEAPPEIKRWAGQGADEMESLTVEYAKVVVMRPWFNPSFFESRYWRLPPDAGVVSDGLLPRKGRIPAFITNMIVARKVTIERPKTIGPGGGGADDDAKTAMRRLGFMAPALVQLDHTWKMTIAGEVKATRVTAAAGPRPPVIAMRAATPGRMHPMAARVRDHRVPASPGVSAEDIRVRSAIARARERTTIRRRAVVLPAPIPAVRPPPPRQERVAEELELDGVAVLAYVCRRLPESPRPDEALVWV